MVFTSPLPDVEIPEVPFTMKALSEHVQHALHARFHETTRAFGTVLLAETAIPLDVEEYLDDPDVALEEKEKAADATNRPPATAAQKN